MSGGEDRLADGNLLVGVCVPRLSAAGQQCQGSCCSGVSDVFRVTPKGTGWGGWGKACTVAEASIYNIYVAPAVDEPR